MLIIFKKKPAMLFLALMISFLSTSCITTSPVCLTSSNTPIHDKKIEMNLGKVEGSSDFFSLSGSSILGLWMIGRPDIQEAIDNALLEREADALINIKCYSTNYWFILWGFSTVTVEGEAVVFEK